MNQRLVEAHARLSFLKMDLPQTLTVEEKYVREFHDILQLLEQVSGCDLGGYRVPAGEVTLRSGGGNGGGENWCALEPAYERARLMSRIDGVLHFFGVQATPHGLRNQLHG
jgi:hypothetical protein